MSLTNIVLSMADSAATLKAKWNYDASPNISTVLFADSVNALDIGANVGVATFNIGAVAASGTVTLSSFAADDTVTVMGVVLTGKASPSTDVQFTIGASDTLTAASLAACINAKATLNPVVSATSAAAVVTITSKIPGTIGNLIGTAISAHGSVAGALLTGGTEGSIVTKKYGAAS